MGRYLKIKFSIGEVLIELLQTPLVEKWIKAHKAYQQLKIPMKHAYDPICYHNDIHKQKSTKHIIEKINNAIDRTNNFIEGENFPYRAYEDMPWMHTNRLHRSFTIGSRTRLTWMHNYTYSQLMNFKSLGTDEITEWMLENTISQFKVLDKEKFLWEVHVINAGIHEFENTRFSLIAGLTVKDYIKEFKIKPYVLHIAWDNDFTYTENKENYNQIFFDNRSRFLPVLDNEELISSFPDNYEDYNVTLHKAIEGKDYETCYQQYDDPLEFDIRNVESINGCISIWPHNEHAKFFINTHFYKWAKNYRLRDEWFLNPPIGKIIEDTVDITLLGSEPIEHVELVDE